MIITKVILNKENIDETWTQDDPLIIYCELEN